MQAKERLVLLDIERRAGRGGKEMNEQQWHDELLPEGCSFMLKAGNLSRGLSGTQVENEADAYLTGGLKVRINTFKL